MCSTEIERIDGRIRDLESEKSALDSSLDKRHSESELNQIGARCAKIDLILDLLRAQRRFAEPLNTADRPRSHI